MRIVAKAPCRVDLAGGTLDIWPLYLYHPGAVTVNFAVDRYTWCDLETRPGNEIRLESLDQKLSQCYSSMEELRKAARHNHSLAALASRFFAPKTGFTLTTDSEAPAGAGISGSSALMIAVCSALNRLTNSGHGLEKIREIAQNVEAQMIGVPTGSQDYYPALYGQVNAIEFGPAGIRRSRIPVDLDQLNRRFVLAYTGAPRNSGINNWEVTKRYIDGDRRVVRNFEQITSIAIAMRNALAQQEWAEMGRLLRDEWEHRRKNAPGITTELIDNLIQRARRAGALGAKVCGAGGGGCVLFLVEPERKALLTDLLSRSGVTVLPVKVARHGIIIQTSRLGHAKAARSLE